MMQNGSCNVTGRPGKSQLEFLAKEESNRIGKEVTMTDLAEWAVRQQIKRMKQKDRKR